MASYLDPVVEGLKAELEKADTRIAQLESDLAEALQREQRLENLMGFHTGAKELSKGLMLEYGRLDVMWQKLVRERDEAKGKLATVTSERDYLQGWKQGAEESAEIMRRELSDAQAKVAALVAWEQSVDCSTHCDHCGIVDLLARSPVAAPKAEGA